MNEEQLCQAVAEQAVADHHAVMSGFESHKAQAGGQLVTWVQAIIAWLRSSGVTWTSIFKSVSQIVSIVIASGGDWQAVIAAVLALFFPSGAGAVGAPAQP